MRSVGWSDAICCSATASSRAISDILSSCFARNPLGRRVGPPSLRSSQYSFSTDGPILAASRSRTSDATSVTYLYDVSSFSSVSPASQDNSNFPTVCCIPLESEMKKMGDEQCLLPNPLGICLFSSPSSSQSLVTTHKGLSTNKIVLWNTLTMSPTDFIDAPLVISGVLQLGGGESNNNTRFTLSGACEDGTIGALECWTPSRSVMRMTGKISKVRIYEERSDSFISPTTIANNILTLIAGEEMVPVSGRRLPGCRGGRGRRL